MSTVTLQAVPTDRYPTGVTLTKDLVMRSETLKNIIEDFQGSVSEIPVGDSSDPENQNNDVVAAVFEYLLLSDQHPQEKKEGEEPRIKSSELADWEKEFFDNLGKSSKHPTKVLFNLILAANFLDVKPVVKATAAKIASMIKGKTPEQIRETFLIKE